MEKTLKIYTYIDGVNDAPFPNVPEQIKTSDFTVNLKRMGAVPTITCTVQHSLCLDDLWTGQEYAVFNEEKYYLKQTPTSSFGNDSALYKHELELVSERIILDNVYFYDSVINSAQSSKPISNSTKFAFFGTIFEFADRLNQSLVYSKLQTIDEKGNYIDGYRVVVDDDVIDVGGKKIELEDAFISNVIQESYNTYEIPYYFIGKTIHIGYTNNVITETFKYGRNDSLLSIKKQNANYKVVNRATGYGSEQNLTYYYPNQTPKGDVAVLVNGVESGKAYIKNPENVSNFSLDDAYIYTHQEYKQVDIEIDFYSILYQRVKSEVYDGGNMGAVKSNSYSFVVNGSFNIDETVITKLILNKPDEYAFRPYEFYLASATSIFTITEVSIEMGENSTNDSDKIIWSDAKVDEKWKDGVYVSEEFILAPKQKYIIHIQATVKDFAELKGADYFAYPSTRNLVLQKVASATAIYQEQKEEYYWLLKDTDKKVVFDKLGIGVTDSIIIGDVITFKQIRYIKPADHLMPPIYRETLGDERFYNALNDEYVNEETGEYFYYPNPYIDGRPKEHIVSFEDIKPTIKEMTNAKGQRIDMFSEFAYDLYDNDEIDEEGNYKHPYFFAKLRKTDGEHGFNLFDHALESGEMTISMTSGYCGGCSFVIGVDSETKKNPVQILPNGTLARDSEGNVVTTGVFQDAQNDTQNNEVWIALKKDIETYATILPSAAYPASRPTTKDTFVILHIRMPQAYITSAEDKLEQEILSYMEENNVEKFNFSITFSRIYLATNPNILAQLNDHSLIEIEYNSKKYSLYVSSFTYRMSSKDLLPEITVELNETLSISKNALQNSIDTVKEEMMSGITGTEFYKVGVKYFMQKTVMDKATAKQEFARGVVVKNGLDVDTVTAKQIKSGNVEATELVTAPVVSAKDVKATSVDATSIHAAIEVKTEGKVDANEVISNQADIENADIGNAEIEEASIEHAEIKTEDVGTSNITQLNAALAQVSDTLTANKTRVVTEISSERFADGLAGYGFKIDATGKAKMRSLELFESLIVPELRYNRVTVITGEQWQSSGGGIIEAVDETTQTFVLRLEEGELPTLGYNDLCKGIYHFGGDSSVKGFQTSYFKVLGVAQGTATKVEGTTLYVDGEVEGTTITLRGSAENGLLSAVGDAVFRVKYELRGGTTIHPQPNMSFVAYGNTTNVDRQQSIYSTLRYKRYLVGVNDWDIREDNIAMQLGDLSELVIGGKSFSGYSAYLSNIYMTGVIKQLSGDGNTYSVPVDRGAWQSGQKYYYYDRVSHNGSIWLCVASETDVEPNTSNADWLLEVSKGEKGEDGTSIKVSGTLDSESELPTPPQNESDCYIIGNDLYVWNGSEWTNVGQFKGEDGIGISSTTELYYLSTSPSEMKDGEQTTSYPAWENGKYLWTSTRYTYTNGNTVSTAWRCITGATGANGEDGRTGKTIRPRGVYAASTTYVNNTIYRDVVLYNGSYYTPKYESVKGVLPTVPAYWSPFNEFQNVATSVLLANQGYIDVLGSGRIFIGQNTDDDRSNGWEITAGAIRHLISGLTLTDDGKLVAPNGTFEITTGQGELNEALSTLKVETEKISLKVDSIAAPISDNLFPNTDFTLVDTSKINNYTPFDKWLLYGSASSVIEDSDHLGKKAVYVNATSGYHGVRCTSHNFFGLSADEEFTISLYGKASSPSNAIQLIVRYLDASFSEITSERKSIGFYPSTSWVRKDATFKRTSSADAKYMMIDIYTNSAGEHWIAMPKLERGSALTEWTPNVNDYNNKKLLATGIDIEKGEITVTTDTFKIQDNSGNEMAVFENVEQKDGSLTPMLKTDLIRVKKLDAATGTFSGFIRHAPMIVDLATKDGRALASDVFTHFEGVNYDYLFPNFDKVGQYLIIRNFNQANMKAWLGVSVVPDMCYFFLPYKSADGQYSEFQLTGEYNNPEDIEELLGYSTPSEMSMEAHSLVGETMRIVLDYDKGANRDMVLQFVPLYYSSSNIHSYNFAFKHKPNSLVSDSAIMIDGAYYDYCVTTPYPANGNANVPSAIQDYAMPYVSLECKSEVVMVGDVPCNHIYWETEVGYNITDREVATEE